LKIKTKIAICHTANSKPVKQEVNWTVILPPLVFPAKGKGLFTHHRLKADLDFQFQIKLVHLSEWDIFSVFIK
jgi:hypothetical protein